MIGSSGSDLSRIIYIDKGGDAGLQRDMAVITADGIVGKVMLVYPSVSQVLLINDQSSGVGAILEKSRLQGVLRGTANGEVVLERVMSDEQVPVGETVLTSGGDQIFPKGLHVGSVAKVSNGKDLFLNIKIRAAANLDKLEEVLVLVERQERQATAEENVRVRAADILAQRLPSVPDKPAADASTAAASAQAAVPPASASSAKPVSTVSTEPKANGSATAPQLKNSAASTPVHVVAGAAPAGATAPRASAVGTSAAVGPTTVSTPADHKITVVRSKIPFTAPSDFPGKPATGSKSPASQNKSAVTPSAGPSTKPAPGPSTKPMPPAPSQPPAQPSNPQPPAAENNPQ